MCGVLSLSTVRICVFPSRSCLLSSRASFSLSLCRRLSLRSRQKLLIEPRLTCLLNFLLSPRRNFCAHATKRSLATERAREERRVAIAEKFAVPHVTKYSTDGHELMDPRDAICPLDCPSRLYVTRSLDHHGKPDAIWQRRIHVKN